MKDKKYKKQQWLIKKCKYFYFERKAKKPCKVHQMVFN